MNYSLLHCHSQFSLLNGLKEPQHIVEHAARLDIGAVAISDISSVSGIPQFLKFSKKAGIKPILGCEIKISEYNATANLIALNKNGWDSIIKLVSLIHTNNKYYNGQLIIDEKSLFETIKLNEIAIIVGAPDTILTRKFFNHEMRFGNKFSSDQIKDNFVNPNWVNDSVELLNKYKEIFGGENVYLEATALDSNRPICNMALQGCRYLANKCNLPILATTDSRYINKEDAADFRTLLCIDMDTTYDGAEDTIVRKNKPEYEPFFDSYNHFIPTYEALAKINTEKEILATNEFADRVEIYDIIPKQSIPTFPAPNNLSQQEYLLQLCREGWKNRGIKNDQRYIDRIKEELDILNNTNGLPSYFLIVQDYVDAARKRGELVGISRGSAGGCLVSYLLAITELDPIPYNLLFSRFYNAGRNTKDHIAMPDIDIDFPSKDRQNTFDYIREKYGDDKVAQVVTFIKIKGKGALKDVLRVSGKVPFNIMNKMTENIPDEAAISDQLQLMKDAGEEPKIIKWAIDNHSEDFSEWINYDDNGNLVGTYSREFAQAIRLEGTRKAYGKHAAGLIVSNSPLADMCPIFLDKSGKNKMIGFEFKELEELGFVKFDILATTVLDKSMGVNKLLDGGDFEDE